MLSELDADGGRSDGWRVIVCGIRGISVEEMPMILHQLCVVFEVSVCALRSCRRAPEAAVLSGISLMRHLVELLMPCAREPPVNGMGAGAKRPPTPPVRHHVCVRLGLKSGPACRLLLSHRRRPVAGAAVGEEASV